MVYRTPEQSTPVQPIPLSVGKRLKVNGDRHWWTVRAVTDNYAAITRNADFEPAGTRCYSVIDWRNGVRGPCNLIGQGYGDGTYTEQECADMLARFESGDLEVSHRNWVRVSITSVED